MGRHLATIDGLRLSHCLLDKCVARFRLNCFSALAANFTNFTVKPVEMWESGDSVWVTFVAESTQGRIEGAHLNKVEGGKVVYFRAFDDTQTAAGLLS